jgi:hypothetical protein
MIRVPTQLVNDLNMKIKAIAAILFSLLQSAYGIEGLDIHGYLSQTFVQTSDNDNYVEDSTKGSFKWTDFSVNFYKTYSDFDFAAQINTRNVGDGSFETTLDWGYGSYSFHEALGVRVGKVRTAAVGMHNEYRDIDFSRTSILLPQSIYEEGSRELILGVQGLSLFGDYGPFRYMMSYGTFDVPDDFRLNNDIKNVMGADSFDPKIDYDFSALLQYQTPVDGLGLAFTYHTAKVDSPLSGVTVAGLKGNLQGDYYITQQTAGITYDRGPWNLSGEYTWQDNNMNWTAPSGGIFSIYAAGLNRLGFVTDKKRRWYVLLNRQITEKLSSEMGYDSLVTDRSNSSSPRNYRKTYSAAIRYDFRESLLLKLQFNTSSGYADTLAASQSILTGKTPGRKWNTVLARVTFQF